MNPLQPSTGSLPSLKVLLKCHFFNGVFTELQYEIPPQPSYLPYFHHTVSVMHTIILVDVCLLASQGKGIEKLAHWRHWIYFVKKIINDICVWIFKAIFCCFILLFFLSCLSLKQLKLVHLCQLQNWCAGQLLFYVSFLLY